MESERKATKTAEIQTAIGSIRRMGKVADDLAKTVSGIARAQGLCIIPGDDGNLADAEHIYKLSKVSMHLNDTLQSLDEAVDTLIAAEGTFTGDMWGCRKALVNMAHTIDTNRAVTWDDIKGMAVLVKCLGECINEAVMDISARLTMLGWEVIDDEGGEQ